MMVVVVVMVVVVRQYLWLGERWYLHQSLVLVCLERAQCGLGQHGLCRQHGLQLLQRQGLSRCNGKLQGRRDHAWRQDEVGPRTQVLRDDQCWGARLSRVAPMGLVPCLGTQGQARGMGWPQGQLEPLYLP